MFLSEPVEDLLKVVRLLREDQDVFTPMVTWHPEDGAPIVAHLTESTGDTKTDLDTAFQQLRDLTGPPEWFAVTLDSYSRDGTAEEMEDISLEEAFLQGDMRVIEQMVTIFMTPSEGELVMIRQVYRHTPVDGWEWDSPQLVESPGDAITTAVRMFH